MKGLVIKNTGSWYTVRTDDGRDVESKVKGNFRLKEIRSTNPVSVGDRVDIDINNEGTAFITKIEDRKNYIAYYCGQSRSGHVDRNCQLSDYYNCFYRSFSGHG